jgi:hypothetical protein
VADEATIGWDDVVQVSASQVSTAVSNEIAILNLDRGMYYGLNPTGARIWECVQSPVRVREIHALLLSEYEVDAEALQRDILQLLGQLRDQGLIEVQPAVNAR